MNIEQILAEPNGSIESLNVNLDGLPINEKYDLLPKLLSKLVKGGSITISGQDIYAIAKSILYSKHTILELNSIVANIRSLDTPDNIKRFLLEHNFKTEICKRDNTYYVCTARHSM
jgi:hypothetical protein